MCNRSYLFHSVLVGMSIGIGLAASSATAAPEARANVKKDRPSMVEAIDGSKLKRVILTEKAAKRLDIQTSEMLSEKPGQLTAPYSSLMYDPGGGTWVYTVPKPFNYVRQSVVIETIKGEKAYLKEGPPVGTVVVTVGIAELYGTEKGIGGN